MEKYLPEWFNEKEFESFLAEGPLTRQAWVRGLKRWRRTKFVLRNLIGQTPMKYISRTMKSKHAIMARTAMQNTRDIQAAQDREEAEDAKRNYIRQEHVNFDFESLISEKLNSGSDRSVHFGLRPSANERATMRNLTGNPKVQAKLKKREQRKDEARYSTESFILDEQKKNVRTPDMKPEEQPKGRKNLKGNSPKAKEKPQKEKETPTQLAGRGNVSKAMVVRGKDKKVRIISVSSFDSKVHTRVYPQNKDDKPTRAGLQRFLGDKDFSGSLMASKIFPKDDRAKPERKASPKKVKKAARRIAAKTAQKKLSSDIPQPWELIPPDPNAVMRQGPTPKAKQAEESIMLSQLMMDPKLSKKLYDMGFTDDNRMAMLNQMVQENPALLRLGEDARREMVGLAAQQNQYLAGKKLIALSTSGKKGCIALSEEYIAAGATDTTSRADIIIVAETDLEGAINYLNGTNCDRLKGDFGDKIFGFSYKKGRAQLASSQAADTLATLATVQDLIKEVNDNEVPREMQVVLDDLIQEIKRLQDLAKAHGGSESGGTVTVADPNITVTALKKMGEKQTSDYDVKMKLAGQLSTQNAQQFLSGSKAIKENIQRHLETLMSQRLFKSALVYAQASGNKKFAKGSLGKAQGIFMADSNGEFLDTIMLPPSFKEALENPAYSEKFEELVSVQSINVRAKSRSAMGGAGRELTPVAFRTETFLSDELDNLFEYTFLPADINIVTMSQTIPDQVQAENNPMMGFASFSNASDRQDEFLNRDTVLSLLAATGVVEALDFDIVDFEELGLRTRSLGSPIINKVTVNGVDFEIPVVSPRMDESFINQYENLNDAVVNLVETGMGYDQAYALLQEGIEEILSEKARDYKREYKIFHSKPLQRQKRSRRVLARRKMAKKLGKKAIKGKDIDHKDGNALNNGDSNLRVRSINKNRADNGHSKKIQEMWGAGLEGSWELTKKWLRETPGQLGLIDPKLLKILMGNKGKSR
jgi:hypothetical protein